MRGPLPGCQTVKIDPVSENVSPPSPGTLWSAAQLWAEARVDTVADALGQGHGTKRDCGPSAA